MSKEENARARAIAVLEQWERKGVPVDLLVEEELRQPFADRRDSQLCRALIYGVIRWLGYLDWVLVKYSKHPLEQMKPLTRQALRTALYQLVFMDRVPVSAAINETVKILKKNRQPSWLTGFANGLLRRVSRELDTLPKPGQAGEAGIASHCLFSHPHWLYERWAKRYTTGRTEAICRANNQEAELCLRVLVSRDDYIDKLAAAGIAAVRGGYAPYAVVLPGYRGRVLELPGYAEGLFMVQDEAAQLAAGLLGTSLAAGSYLDACAGLGGKTVYLAAMLVPGAALLAVEPDRRRAGLLAENLRRLGLDRAVETFEGRLEALPEREGQGFDGILIDAPCSGLGVIRRHPDIRWNRQSADLQRYRDMQLDLLKEAARRLAAGGVLVYITCSSEPEENEQVVETFLAAHPGFTSEDCRGYLPAAAGELVDAQGFFRTMPDQGLDGFFGARLRENT